MRMWEGGGRLVNRLGPRDQHVPGSVELMTLRARRPYAHDAFFFAHENSLFAHKMHSLPRPPHSLPRPPHSLPRPPHSLPTKSLRARSLLRNVCNFSDTIPTFPWLRHVPPPPAARPDQTCPDPPIICPDPPTLCPDPPHSLPRPPPLFAQTPPFFAQTPLILCPDQYGNRFTAG